MVHHHAPPPPATLPRVHRAGPMVVEDVPRHVMRWLSAFPPLGSRHGPFPPSRLLWRVLVHGSLLSSLLSVRLWTALENA